MALGFEDGVENSCAGGYEESAHSLSSTLSATIWWPYPSTLSWPPSALANTVGPSAPVLFRPTTIVRWGWVILQ